MEFSLEFADFLFRQLAGIFCFFTSLKQYLTLKSNFPRKLIILLLQFANLGR